MPLIEWMCPNCNEVFERLNKHGEERYCDECGVKMTKLISTPAAIKWNCECQSASGGKPVTDHPRGSNYKLGQEIERVRGKKKRLVDKLRRGEE